MDAVPNTDGAFDPGAHLIVPDPPHPPFVFEAGLFDEIEVSV